MDALVSAALHEIAVEAAQGCPLPKLWTGLQGAAAALELDLDASVKRTLWKQVLHVPGMTFLVSKAQGSQTLEACHPSVQSVEAAEKLGVHVVAPDGLRESCLGLYDGKLCDAAISKDQRELLERLAKARSQGVTQSQLGKEFKTGGNKMFYVVKSLEARGLVVRHATIVRTHQPASKGPNNKFVPIVATNLVHLSRYEKDQSLGSHARYEIPSSSKSNLSHNNASGSGDAGTGEEDANQATEEVLINDDYPAMQRICEKLESAEGKVMVVSDLKLDLNYRFAQGHRSWRRLAKRLQDAGMVEIFNAQIAGSKIAPCIRLLKSFNTKAFNAGNDDTEAEAQLRGVKRGQVTEQVVESVLDRQIYDLIDNSGPAGLYMMDIWKQLGLNNKRNYFRVTNMLGKGCIVSEAEQHKKSMLYRLRTAPNASLASQSALPISSANIDLETLNPQPLAQIAPPSTARIRRGPKKPTEKEKEKQEREKETEREREREREKEKQKEKEKEHEKDTTEDHTGVPSLTNKLRKGPEDSNDCRDMTVVDLSIVKVDEDEPLVATSEQMYPFPLQTTTAIQRELRIMQRLHEEKFIPRVELHRWIEESERDRKDTMMDRKTLTRLLQKLQREGRIKCIVLSMPGLTNCGRSRQSEVVLLPEVQVVPELLAKVHDRIRQFDMINRGYGSSKVKADASTVPVLSVKQIHKGGKRKFLPAAETEADKARTLSENGFVPAKMVRVRMLHTFLWSYVSGISEYADDELVMKPDESSCRVFSLALAVKAMPLDLFLQVIGSTKSTEELEPYTNKGQRLCDLPESESSSLLVSHANSRLSWLIDILRRLKLIRLVMGTGIPLGHSKATYGRGANYSLEASLIYAMEIQPYIEEPAPQPLSSLSLDAFDLTPRARHEFTLTSSESLEAYWQTLEYFFSGAVASVARKAFPGSSVPELFGLRSWTSLRVMTSEQRKKLMKRVEEGGGDKRLSHTECLLLAKELNLSPEQVLRVSYEKNRKHRLSQLRNENMGSSSGASGNEVSRGHRIKPNIHVGFKKRAITDADLMEVAHVRAFKRQRQLEQASAAEDVPKPTGLADIIVNSNKEGETNAPIDEEGEDDEEEEKGTEENPLNNLKTISKLKPARRKRFPWNESLDRVLIRAYARQRAILGARNQRVEWAAIPNLPGNPTSCRRRTALLKSDPAIRKALMNLCTVLSARYIKKPDDISSSDTVKKTNIESDVSEADVQPNSKKDTVDKQPKMSIINLEEDELPWDSFDDISVAAAFNEVMHLISIARALSNSKRSSGFRTKAPKLVKKKVEKRSRKISTPLPSTTKDSGSALVPLKRILPAPVFSREPQGSPGFQSRAPINQERDAPTSAEATPKAPRLRKRRKSEKPAYIVHPQVTSEETVRRSLGIANAVELVKLVLLNAASAEVPYEVVDALRRCEESHVFAAFSYLRYQDYVIAGGNGQPFVLSQKFFYNASASRFPMETGFEALGTTQWLAEHEPEVDEDWVPLPSENLCGQLIQLLGIVSDGDLVIAPFLPEEGVGESEDNKNVVLGTKRKTEGGQEIQFMKPKIQRSESSSPGFRRERGFPGVQVCIHRAAKPVREVVDSAVSQSEEISDHVDQLNDDKFFAVDLHTEQAMPSVIGSVSESTEGTVVDVAVPSSGDVYVPASSREVNIFLPSVPHISGSMETPEIVDLPSSVRDVSQPTEASAIAVAMPSVAENDSELRGSTVIDIAKTSAGGDVSESVEAMEVDVIIPSAPGNDSESKEAVMIDVAAPTAGAADVPESIEAMEVEVTMLSAALDSESTEGLEIEIVAPSAVVDVAESKESAEIEVALPLAVVDVPELKESAEIEVALPSAAENVSEQTKLGQNYLGLVGGDRRSELDACIHHYCPTPDDSSDADEARDSKLKPALLRSAAHAIEVAGKEGLSIPQLAILLALTDHEMTEEVAETYITALETFDVVKQVNAYDHVRVVAAVHSTPFFIHVKAKKEDRSAADAGACGAGNGESSQGFTRGISTMATLTSIATGSRDWTRIHTPIQPNLPTDNSSDKDFEVTHTVPILPWLTGNGNVNTLVLKNLTRKVLGIVMLNPGILEEHLVNQLRALNPQTAKQLLQLLEFDGHVKVRKFLRAQPAAPPGLLSHLMKPRPAANIKPTFGSHYYANCTSGTLL